MLPTHMPFIHTGPIKYYEFAALSNHLSLSQAKWYSKHTHTHTYFTQLMNC